MRPTLYKRLPPLFLGCHFYMFHSLIPHVSEQGAINTHPFLFEKRDFFLHYGLPSTRIQSKQSPKTYSFKIALQSGDFWIPRFDVLVWIDENEGFGKDYVTVWGPVHLAHEIRRQHFVGSPTTTSFICMTIQVNTVLQKLYFVEGLKLNQRQLSYYLVIICHEDQSMLKYI